MNFESILEHHLFDHVYFPLATIGPVVIPFSKHTVVMWSVCVVLGAALTWAARAQSGAGLLLRAAVEAVVFFIRDQVLKPIFGHSTATYLPYFLTLFFFILSCNLAGLIPGSAAVTGNVSVTAALALCTFGLIQYAGVREQGLVSYLKHIAPGGIPWWVLPILYPIELLGMLVKSVALCIRLFANITAGHVVSLAFLSLIFIFAQMHPLVGLGAAPAAVGLALFVYALDVLVSFLQAFIFTFLTALFVGGAVHPH